VKPRAGALIAGVAAIVAAAPASAATYKVTTTADGAAECATTCTLRGALLSAQKNAGADTIQVPAGTYTITIGGLTVDSDVTIVGASAATTSVVSDSKGFRVFNVNPDMKANFSHLTISSGVATGSTDGVGANLLVGAGATVTLDHARVTAGKALRGGGIGIAAGANVTITRSVIDNNIAQFASGVTSGDAGAILAVGGRTAAFKLQISDSTIAKNQASQGAGIVLGGNAANTTTLDRVTIARNAAGSNSLGSGVSVADAESVRIGGSIIANNTGDGTPNNCDRALTSTGGNAESSDQCGFDSKTELVNATLGLPDALTAVGETQVLKLPSNSPAVNAGGGCTQADQRDAPRPQGPSCDSGAYEVGDVQITGGPTGTTNNNKPTFTFAAVDSNIGYRCAFDNAAYASCTSPYTPTAALADGSHSFHVQALGVTGGPTSQADRSFSVDTAPPTVTITSGPSGSVSSTTATFTYSSNDQTATVTCQLDSGLPGPCPVNYSGLSQGSHTFIVRATDPAGNVGSASRTWTVDTVAPAAPTITAGPNGPTNDDTPSFSFTGEAGATFECRVDTGTFTTCTSPYTGSAPAQGAHTFDVRAKDAAGNTGPNASRGFTVDTVKPAAPVITAPTENQVLATGTVAVRGTAEAGTTVTVYEGATSLGSVLAGTAEWQVVAAPVSDGSHTYTARTKDVAGNESDASAARTFRVDTTPPDTTIDSGPSGPTNDATPTYAFHANEAGSTFECWADNDLPAACSTPFTTAALSAGAHTFSVRAVDPAGNRDSTPATRSITVDTTAPAAPTITAGPPSPTNDTTPTFEFTGEAGATLRCGIDTGTFTTCSSPFTTATLTAAQHTFQVQATDAAGNTGAAASRTFTVDLSVPNAPTITSGPSGLTNTTTQAFAFTGDPGLSFECRVDSAAFTSCTSPKSYTGLSEAAHTFEVRTRNSAGTASGAVSRTFTVDTTAPPAPTVDNGPAGTTTDPNPAFTFTATDTVDCKLDGPAGALGSFGSCASPKGFSGLAPGEYLFTVRSTDAAGNTRTSSRAFTVTTVQQATPTPTPTPTGTVTPAQTPTPVPGASVVVAPKSGVVLVKINGQFVPLATVKSIPNGSEVDARKGHVTLTSIPRPGAAPETAEFWDGLFIVTQSRGVTILKLSEKLAGCPKAFNATVAAAKKKTRKLWGSGKGAFKTEGKYSAATVRGTTWLVQDTCTQTTTQVKQGVVSVQDFAKRKSVLVKAPKKYVAKMKKNK